MKLKTTLAAIMGKVNGIADAAKVEVVRHINVVELSDPGESGATILLSTRHLDRDGEVVTPKGWDLQYYQQNPIGLWQHNRQIPAIYRALETHQTDLGLKQRIVFADTEQGKEFWSLVKDGFLRSFSAGFSVTKAIMQGEDGWDKMLERAQSWPEWKKDQVPRAFLVNKTLWESSLANIPANPNALVLAIHKGKIALSDATKAMLRIREVTKALVDAGELDLDCATDEKLESDGEKTEKPVVKMPKITVPFTSPSEKTAKIIAVPSVKVMPEIRMVMVDGDRLALVKALVENEIQARRGKIVDYF